MKSVPSLRPQRPASQPAPENNGEPARPAGQSAWGRWEALAVSRAAVVAVLLLAAGLRFYKASDWSLWLDEVTCVYFSQHPDKPFPHSFPVFFYALNGLYQLTGISASAGRLLAATVGALSVVLAYVGVGRLFDRRVALLAALFIGLSLGHLFWSQAIRYYIFVFLFQVLSASWFLRGLEGDDRRLLVLSNVAFLLALLSHSSAALLLPVFPLYLALAWLRRGSCPAGYSVRNVLIFVALFALVAAFGAWRFLTLRSVLPNMMSGSEYVQKLDLAKIISGTLLRVGGYVGVPLIVLAALAPLLARKLFPGRVVGFFLLCGFLPLLAPLLVNVLGLAYSTWYYGLFAVYGLAVLAAVSVVAVYRRGYRKTGALLGLGAVVYQVPFLCAYFTTMQGDRPRWNEAVELLRQKTAVDAARPGRVRVLSSSPIAVAFALGVPLDETFDQRVVGPIPHAPPEVAPRTEEWYLIEVHDTSNVYRPYVAWLDAHCAVEGRFEAISGPKDRSVVVYRYSPPVGGAAERP